jgi:putative transposase
MIQTVWQTLQQLYTGVGIDEFIVMPDHIHGIVIINKSIAGGTETAPCSSISLPDIIKNFKSYTTFKYIKHVQQYAWEPFEKKLWQRSYHEHIIRNEDRLKTIRQYIINNPVNLRNCL